MPTLRCPRRPSGRLLAATFLAATSLALTAAAPGAGAQVPPPLRSPHWIMDADAIRVLDADEEAFGSDGDELQLVVIAFRTTMGARGSTQAWKVNSLREICTGMDDGDRCTIPNGDGRVDFGTVQRPTALQMAAGRGPELIGTVHLVIENDGTSNSIMNPLMDRLVEGTRRELAAVSEGITRFDPANLAAATAAFDGIGDRVLSYIDRTWLQDAAIWLSSGGDPDDFMGYRINLQVGVDPALRDQVNLALLLAFFTPESKIAASVIGNSGLALPYSDNDTAYELDTRVFVTLV